MLLPIWNNVSHIELNINKPSWNWSRHERWFNRVRSIYQYSNMAPRLSEQTSMFGVVFFVSKSLLGIERQKKLNEITILTRRPLRHFRILIYQIWSIAGSSWKNPSQLLERKSLFSFMSQLICNTYYIL